MRAFVLLAAMVVCAASFDCDTLAEPERTRCLDRAADMNIQMVPVDEEIIPSAHTAQEEPSYDEEDEDTDDIMGDLGEGAKTEAKASATAAAQEDLKLAQASTAGMYDDDVKVARAFSDLTDSVKHPPSALDSLSGFRRTLLFPALLFWPALALATLPHS